MVQTRRVVTTKESQLRILAGKRGARLGAILPAPLKRRPGRMNIYSALILEQMRQMGW